MLASAGCTLSDGAIMSVRPLKSHSYSGLLISHPSISLSINALPLSSANLHVLASHNSVNGQ